MQIVSQIHWQSFYTQLYKPHIIAITEVTPKKSRYNITEAELKLDGYNLWHNLEAIKYGKEGRGTIIYTATCLKANPAIHIQDEIEGSSFKDAVFTSVELDKGDTLLVGCIYRSPNSSVETNNALNSLMRKVGDKYYSHVLITGHFNYPGVNWVDWTTKGESTEAADYKYIKACRDSYLHQHVMNPTRGRIGNQPNLLDLVLTNEEDVVASVRHLGALGASDHCVLLHDLNCYVTLTPTAHTRYVYDKGDYAKLREILDLDWDEVFHDCKDDVEQQYKLFLDHYNAAVDECIPRKIFTNIGSQGRTPLDQNRSVRSIVLGNASWKPGRAKNTYCRERNWVRHLTRKLKKAYEKSIAQQSKANPKKFWRYVKSKTKTRSVIPDLISPAAGQKISGDLERAELLSLYFSSGFTQEPPGEIPRLPHLQLTTLLERLDISTDMSVQLATLSYKTFGCDQVPI
ncbi:hypothetical protein NHX12_027749 [Muraenolepis orangiensis]|uniref:Endonuclease/exonuclease/phosphatase domain-containing protein n=1 Tax=Muraenolepis orangiensis TaxID=630683 RepID=A0A9Q0EHX7_9TELE|nr:hypothetical protein NHX12_027749 [Muraenolepis orangiensis]